MVVRLRRTVVGTAALTLLLVGVASADESQEVQAAVEEAVAAMAEQQAAAAADPQPEPEPAAPMERYELSPTEGNPMAEPWSYNTEYFFGLTRGLPDAGCTGSCRPWVIPWTAVTDVVTLPGAALAGLFG